MNFSDSQDSRTKTTIFKKYKKTLVSDKKHNNPCNSLIIRQQHHFNSWWAWFFIFVAFFSSPSKIEGVRGSMTESRCCFSNCFHTPQSLRDSSPILREQLFPLFPDTNNKKTILV